VIRVLIVCTGNTCRSPMVEGMLRASLPLEWMGRVDVSSAGTSAWEGAPASPFAVDVLRDDGVDISGHRSRFLTREMIDESDLVVAMARKHRDRTLELVPSAEDKVILIGELDESRSDPDISDPIGGDRSVYLQTKEELKGLVPLLIEYIGKRFQLKSD